MSTIRTAIIPALSLLSILAFSSLGSLLFDFSFLYTLSITGFVGTTYLLFRSPLALLLALIVVRMSLDFFGETVTLGITENVSITLSQLIGVGVALLGIMLFAANSQARQTLPRLWPLLVISLWGLASLTISVAPDTTARELLRVFDIITLAALAYASVHSARDYGLLLGSIFVSSIVPIGIGIYQFVMGIGFQDEAVDIPRIYGTFSHPNVFSLYLFVLIAVTALAAVRTRRQAPLPDASLLLLGIIFATTLLITYTRVAWVVLFVFLLVIGVTRFRTLLIPLVVVPFLLYILVLPFQERVDSIFHADPGSSVSWRQSLWSATVHRTLSEGRAITGFGMGTFYDVSGALYDPSIGQNEAHNDFVKFFVEGGAIGLLAYMIYGWGILWPLARRAFTKGTDPTYLILFALALSLTAASLSDNIFKNTPVQWIFWTLLAATFKVFPKKISPPEKRAFDQRGSFSAKVKSRPLP